MKYLISSGVFFLSVGLAAAGNIDILGVRSAAYLMEPARNAAYDCADGVTYNPAGLVFLPDGIHTNFSTQYISKDYTISGTFPGDATSTEVSSTEPTPFLPNLYSVYKKGNFAAFGGFSVPAGGGSLNYKDGIFLMPLLETVLVRAQYGETYFAAMNSGHMQGSSYYYRGTAGVAYALSETFGAAISCRYTSAHRNYSGAAEFTVIDAATMLPADTIAAALDVNRRASGFSALLGFDYKPSEKINLAVRYETSTPLDFESSTDSPSSWEALMPYLADGAKQRRDLPAVAALGARFFLNDRFVLSGSACYYFLNESDQGTQDGIIDAYGDGWEAGISGRLQLSKSLAAGLGYSYTDYGGSDSTYTDLEYNMDSGLLSGGINWKASSVFDFTLAGGTTFTAEGNGIGMYSGETYNKTASFLAVGVSASF